MRTFVIDYQKSPPDSSKDTPPSITAAHSLLEEGDSVRLFHSVFHPQLADADSKPDKHILREAIDLLLHGRRDSLGRIGETFARYDLDSQVAWTDCGWQALLRYARAQHADMVIAQSDRPTRWQRISHLNRDWQLIRHCSAPLMLTRPGATHQYQRILAAVDPVHVDDKPAELDHRILRHAAAIARRHKSSFHVLNVIPPIGPVAAGVGGVPATFTEPVFDGVLEGRRQLLQQLVSTLDCPVDDVRVVVGVPSHEIVAHAAKQNADLVVMGAVSRTALRNLLIGSTAEKVLDQLRADTLIIKPGAHTRRGQTGATC